MTIQLPEEVEGHWEGVDGYEMAQRYTALDRSSSRIGMNSLTDFALANRQYMVTRSDLDQEVWQTAAKDRIRWLSVQLALANVAGEAAVNKLATVEGEYEEQARELAAAREQLASISSPKAKSIGYEVGLPTGYQYGEDAMENFNFGAQRATDALLPGIHALETELAAERALRIAAEQAQMARKPAETERMLGFCLLALKDLVDAAAEGAVDLRGDEAYERVLESAQRAQKLVTEADEFDPFGNNYEDYLRDRRQSKIFSWKQRTFSAPEMPDPTSIEECLKRTLEEFLELYQAIHPYDAGRMQVLRTLEETYLKPVGQIDKELGQHMVTLNILAERLGISIVAEEKREWSRILTIPKSVWLERWKNKLSRGM